MTEKKAIPRGNWTGKLDFILSCIGFAVGLGNVWRFPYLCFRNGGGAFIIPYAIMLFVAGLPLFYFELCLGQFASEGPITVWRVSPLFYGIGWAMVIITALVALYYNVIIMYAIYYMFVSFVHLDDMLPWQTCDNEWNNKLLCRTQPYPDIDSMNETSKVTALLTLKNVTCVETFLANISQFYGENWETPMDVNSTILNRNFTACDYKFVTPSEEYWVKHVLRLDESSGIGDLGPVSLKNCLCLLLAWVVIFACLMKGIKSSGKVVYFTATFPYFVLIVLLIRGVTLEGASVGIDFYMVPKWELLKNPKVWGDAATQIFYSLGPAFGGLLTMASYNKFKNNCLRDALIVAFINCGTSIFAGFAVFSLLGHISTVTNRPIESVVDDGPGLAFIAYPEGIARLPGAPIWAFLFFFMIFTLGLDTQFAFMETIISAISDLFPYVLRKRKTLFTGIVCAAGFLLGLPQVTAGGIYVLTLLDWYAASYSLMIIGMIELIAVNWFYGFPKFRQDIEMMLGQKHWITWIYWAVTWCAVTPVAILFILVMSAIYYTPASYNSEPFPFWAEIIGWIMVVIPALLIVIGAIVTIIQKGGPLKAIRPDPRWGPQLDEDRYGRYKPFNDERNGYQHENKAYQADAEFPDNEKNKGEIEMPYPYSARL